MKELENLLKVVREESFSEEMEELGNAATKEFETITDQIKSLHDTNTALVIYNRRLRMAISMSLKAFSSLDEQGSMFISEQTKEFIAEARKQIILADNSIARSAEICENIQ